MVRDKDIQMDKLHADNKIDMGNFEAKLKHDYEFKAQQDQAAFSKVYFKEKEELCMELKLLQNVAKDHEKLQLDTDLRFFMLKWHYYSQV